VRLVLRETQNLPCSIHILNLKIQTGDSNIEYESSNDALHFLRVSLGARWKCQEPRKKVLPPGRLAGVGPNGPVLRPNGIFHRIVAY
jgi:hypothetical protein